MNKKSVAASIVVVFAAIVFSVIGICFSVFVFSDTKILVTKVSVKSVSGVEIFEDEKLTKKTTELKLSDMQLGLKPATGEVDADSQIPSSVNEQNASEGYYATVYVKTSIDYKIIVTDIAIESDKNEMDIKEERENIFISIKDVNASTKTLENDETEIASFEDVSETQKLIFFIWLGAYADDILEGSKISFTLEFIAL